MWTCLLVGGFPEGTERNMQTIAIVNEKGGTAKTTTTVNLAATLGELGKRVLLVDLDGQAASSRWLGVDEDSLLADAILRGGGLEPIPDVIPGVSLAPASGKLDSVAHDLRPTQGGQLRKVLLEVRANYEYILIDCPPSLGNRLIGNALLAATHAIAPVETTVLALDGLRILLTMLEDIRYGFDHDIELLGALACRYNAKTRLSQLVLAELQRALPGRVFRTVIRENAEIQECPASGVSILEYAPNSTAAEDYRALAQELLAGSVAPAEDGTVEGDLARYHELTHEERATVTDFRKHVSAVLAAPPSQGEDAPAPALQAAPAGEVGQPAEQTQAPEGPPEATGEAVEEPGAAEQQPAEGAPVVVAQEPEEEAVVTVAGPKDPVAALSELADRHETAHGEDSFPLDSFDVGTQPEEPPEADEDTEPEALAPRRKTKKHVLTAALVALFVGLIFAGRYVFESGKPGPGRTDAEVAERPSATRAPQAPTLPGRARSVGPEKPQVPPSAAPTGETPPVAPTATAEAGPPVPPSARDGGAEPRRKSALVAFLRGRLGGLLKRRRSLAESPKPPPFDDVPGPLRDAPAGKAAPAAAPGQPATPPGGTNVPPAAAKTNPGEQGIPEGYRPCPPGFDLTCILKSGASRWAIINGQIVDIGQIVNGAKVIRIFPEFAEMELDGERFRLHIGQRSAPKLPPPEAPTDEPAEEAPGAGETQAPSAEE